MHRLLFSKSDTARYISHLDLMRTFQRAFLRAGLDIRHTEGFNRHAFVSLPLPLSVGFSSDCELLEFELLSPMPLDEVPARLTAALPSGIAVERCYLAERPIRALTHIDYRIILEYDAGVPSGGVDAMRELLSRKELLVAKKSKKAKSGEVLVDVIPHVKEISFTGSPGGLLLRTALTAQNPGLNPQVLLAALTAEPRLAPDFARYHRREILDETGAVFR